MSKQKSASLEVLRQCSYNALSVDDRKRCETLRAAVRELDGAVDY